MSLKEKRLNKIKKQIRKSGLFDEQYYKAQFQNPPEGDILEYYFLNAAKENKNPSLDFDNNFYLEKYADVKEKGINPLYHYITVGKAEGRMPYDPKKRNIAPYEEWIKKRKNNFKYKIQNVFDVITVLKSGMFEGQYYLDNNRDVEKKIKASFGWKMRLSKNPVVSSVGRILTTPVIHYCFKGVYEDRKPCYEFLTSYYVNENPKLLESLQNPFVHYIKYGKAEGRGGNFPNIEEMSFSDIFAQNAKFYGYKTAPKLSIICRENIAENILYDNKEIIVPEKSLNEAVKKSTGDIVWVLENETADYDFLEKAVQLFKDESVYAVIKLPDSKEEILSYIDFEKKFGIPSNDIKMSNIIFRNIKDILDFDSQYIYPLLLKLIAGKKISVVCGDTENVCELTDKEKYYLDILSVLTDKYALNNSEKMKFVESVRANFGRAFNNGYEIFEKKVNLNNLFGNKKPNILVGIYAFSFGGGEIMPIRLANKLYDMGYNLCVYCFKREAEYNDPKVRSTLNQAIPVIYARTQLELALNIKKLGIQVISTHHQNIQSFVADTLEKYPQLKAATLNVATSHGMYENLDDETLNSLFNGTSIIKNTDYWTYVADKNIKPFIDFNVYDEDKFIKIPNGMERPEIHSVDLSEYGIDENSFVVTVVSRALLQKGWLHAINAATAAREKTGKDIHLLLLGEGEFYTENANKMSNNFIHFLGFRNNPCDYFAKSNLCILPSYYASESAPLCIIEALMCGIPVLASNIGDVKYMLEYEGKLAGDIFELENMTVNDSILTEKLIKFVVDKEFYNEAQKTAVLKSKEFEIENICKKYIDVYNKYYDLVKDISCNEAVSQLKKSGDLLKNSEIGINCPKVSVVVPNYNHSAFLRQRLDCIYNQSYKNIQVLLLDDCSSDNSREIMEKYAKKYPEKSCILFNEKNSGGVFYQWAKGIKNADGDLVWIAESDDFCQTDMLEKLVPAFEDEKVQLSYCQYAFVNEKGEEIKNGFFNYIDELDSEKWHKNYVNDSNSEVCGFLGIKNTIPNASGAVFRKPNNFKLFDYDEWYKMKICGDWIFYLCILKDGKVAYSTDTKSCFRFHSSNSSAKTYTNDTYYKEHEMVAETIVKLYNVPRDVIERNNDIIFEFYREHVGGTRKDFEKLYSVERVLR